MRSFFEPYPELHEKGTSVRLGARYKVLIERNLTAIEGKSIIDTGAHNGRWAFAALKAGASKVYLLEGRQDLLDQAKLTFDKYGIAPDRYELVCGDVIEILKARNIKVDTVFFFGTFYHIPNHFDWVSEGHRTGAHTIIIDTHIAEAPDSDKIVRFKMEEVENIMNSPIRAHEASKMAIAGHPSRGFVKFAFRAFGYEVTECDWAALIRQNGAQGLKDYSEGRRSTFVARAKAQ